ncbi:hypothetical protein ABMA70_05015 [Halobacteriovorax sp. XZX-3]|uniref:hypothetical protein n=1 Tax=unclassified Halobacteriovorax TaxID=2639665 RepID=UPI00371CC1DF
MASFIYHGVPVDFEGQWLHPLFDLKERMPHVFESEIKKYDDHPKRKKLPLKNIPKLNCRRGEVLHCSSIHPSLVFQALKSVFPDINKSVKFFKIPVSSLKELDLVIFDMNRPEYEFGLETDPDSCFEIINHDTYEEIKIVPPEALSFFEDWKSRGERSAPAWGKVPHIFVKGSIDTSGLEIIDWRDPV